MTLPKDFELYTRNLMGDNLYSRLEQGLSQSPETSIRLNPLKWQSREWKVADEDGLVPWCGEGTYLRRRPAFTSDPLMHAGLYYVQEASSMFVGHVLQQEIKQPATMLDLCAAPGGKTIAARAALPEGSLLISNEPIRLRAQILSENVQKLGHPDVIVTNNYAPDFKKAGIMFDIVLADVPCSGEGMFRKDEGAISEWSAANVDKCSKLQRQILSDIWPMLKPGGLLVYSTCTFNAKEDEENAEWIASELGADFVQVPTRPEWNIMGALSGSVPVCRFIPGVSRGEGLFMAALRKHGETNNAKKENKKRNAKNQRSGKTELPLKNPESYETRTKGDSLIAIKKQWAEIYDRASRSLNILSAGIEIGTQKGRGLVPSQSLALSAELQPGSFAACNLEYSQAIAYLRKEAITLPGDTPKGFVLVEYKGLPIGFVKNLGNRSNNLYPQEWRIKSQHLQPEENIITTK